MLHELTRAVEQGVLLQRGKNFMIISSIYRQTSNKCTVHLSVAPFSNQMLHRDGDWLSDARSVDVKPT